MDLEAVKEIALVAGIPLGIYLYHKYMQWTAEDSDGGEKVTWDELVDTFSDAEFWDHVDAVKNEIDEE